MLLSLGARRDRSFAGTATRITIEEGNARHVGMSPSSSGSRSACASIVAACSPVARSSARVGREPDSFGQAIVATREVGALPSPSVGIAPTASEGPKHRLGPYLLERSSYMHGLKEVKGGRLVQDDVARWGED